MLSPVQRNQLRRRAALESAAVAPAMTMGGATAYEQQLMALAQDRLRLKQVQSGQGKAELKRQLIPAYLPYVEGVLSAGNGAQDEVITTLMVWNIDAEDYDQALTIGEYVLTHDLKMPDRFARTTACLLAEEVANGALRKLKADDTFDNQILSRAIALTAEHDMPDQARAKLHLAAGKSILNEQANTEAPLVEQLEMAHTHLARAIDLHDNCGGKKDLEQVNRLLKKHADTPATANAQPEPEQAAAPADASEATS